MFQLALMASANECRLAKSPAGALWLIIFILLLVGRTGAAQPSIGKIETFSTNQVLVHFDVQANTTCTLQCTHTIPTNHISTTWSNLWTSPNLPFFEHYIILDTRTSRQRFYRLQVGL